VKDRVIERLNETARSSWDLANHAGASRWEIFAKASRVEELCFRPSPPVLRGVTEETGVALRMLTQEGSGFGAASGLGPDAAKAAVLGAGNSLVELPFDPLPPFHALKTEKLSSPRPMPPRSWARDTASDLTEAILREVGDHTLIQELVFHEASVAWLLNTAEGFTANYEDSVISISVRLGNRKGAGWRHEEWFRVPDAEHFDPAEAAGRIAARTSLMSLEQKARDGLFDLLLHPEMTAYLAAALAPLFLPGPSDPLQHLIDGQGLLTASCLSLVEDQGNPHSPGRAPCDGEGYPVIPHLLLDQGVPRHHPCSYFESRLYGDPARGGTVRLSYRDRPRAGFSSLHLLSERADTPETLIPSRGQSLYLIRPLAPVRLNVEQDSFHFLASGAWLDSGRPRFSQPFVEIRGSLSHLLHRIEAVGKDLHWFQTPVGFVAAPTLFIRCQHVSA